MPPDARARGRSWHDGSTIWVEPVGPDYDRSLRSIRTGSRKRHAQGKRSPLYGQAGTYIQKIYNRLLIDLSYNSARLEGNTYTLADTEHLVIQGVSAQGKLDAERIMILNHREAIRYLAQNVRSLTPNEETIRTLHYLLSDSLVAPGMAGQIRSESIGVTGTTYAPLEGKERLTQLLNQLLDTARRIDDPQVEPQRSNQQTRNADRCVFTHVSKGSTPNMREHANKGSDMSRFK